MTKKSKIFSTKNICTIALCATAFFVYNKLPQFTYKYAKGLYDAHKYEQALPYFDVAMRLDKNNLDAYYYYAKTLDSMKMTYDVQKRLFELSNVSKSGAAATIANNKIKKYRYNLLTALGGNYIQQVTYQDKILRWNPDSFPIKVYIDSDQNIPGYYIKSVKDAFTAWSRATKNFLKFEFVDDEKSADIDFRFQEKDTTNCTDSNCKYILAYTEPQISGTDLRKSNIRFADTDFYNKPFSEGDVYYTAMHEIGHALGIAGHSFNERNLMFPSKIEDRSVHGQYITRGITVEDLNTIKLLYWLSPDITNKPISKKAQKNLIYAPIVLGNRDEINNKKIEQAKQYIKNAPGLPIGYIDLASAYYELENYQEAINNLYLALLRTTNQKDKYQILYNMTITYFEARDYKNALNYAQETAAIQSTTEILALEGYLKSKIRTPETGIKELEKLVTANPQDIDCAQYYIRALLDNKETLKAGNALREIKRNNPDAQRDPRILQFGVLNNFFK